MVAEARSTYFPIVAWSTESAGAKLRLSATTVRGTTLTYIDYPYGQIGDSAREGGQETRNTPRTSSHFPRMPFIFFFTGVPFCLASFPVPGHFYASNYVLCISVQNVHSLEPGYVCTVLCRLHVTLQRNPASLADWCSFCGLAPRPSHHPFNWHALEASPCLTVITCERDAMLYCHDRLM